MNPTLGEPDVLEIEPYRDRPVRAGDIVLFHAPGRAESIVHRVESVTLEGIRTRGDGCFQPDDWLIGADQIIGRVTAARRGGRVRNVANGFSGRLWAQLLRVGLPFGAAANRFLHAPYRAIAGAGRIWCWLPSGWRPRKVLFAANGRRIWRMLWGRLVIGQMEEGCGGWRIRRPFRLLIDPRELDLDP
ncbi:MAG: S26 family signal peptidase [Anaerolineales bacterium]|nr:S26 family signal peptidase [Anaerolineales bacterium]